MSEVRSYSWGSWGPGWEEPSPGGIGARTGPVPKATARLGGLWAPRQAGIFQVRKRTGKGWMDGWMDDR